MAVKIEQAAALGLPVCSLHAEFGLLCRAQIGDSAYMVPYMHLDLSTKLLSSLRIDAKVDFCVIPLYGRRARPRMHSTTCLLIYVE